MVALEEAGVHVEVQHHEVGTAGQAEIDMRFGTLLRMAGQVIVGDGRFYIGGLLAHAPALLAFAAPTTNWLSPTGTGLRGAREPRVLETPRIEPPTPIDKDLYELASGERAQVRNTPRSLQEALEALERDDACLLGGDVFRGRSPLWL